MSTQNKPGSLEFELDSILEQDPTGRSPWPDREVLVFSTSSDEVKGLSIEEILALSRPNLSFSSLPGGDREEASLEAKQGLPRRTIEGAQGPEEPGSLPQSEDRPDSTKQPDVANKYKLLQKLAEGGEGVVYLARHTGLQLNPMRVIKFLPAEKRPTDDTLKRFVQEIELTSALSQKSEHIVRIYDDFGVSETDGCFYIMEHLDGCTLQDYLRQHRPLRLSLALHIFKQLCQGIAAIHDAGVLHQDIKPKNIFLIKRADNEHFVKVGDFGIAKKPFDSKTHFAGNQGAGTPAYMAPEQISDTQVDFRTDIYALGLILFELITGQKPFKTQAQNIREARKELSQAHLHESPPLMQTLLQRTTIPTKLEELVQQTLEKRIEARPDNVAHLLAVIEEIERESSDHKQELELDTQETGSGESNGLQNEVTYNCDTPDLADSLIILRNGKQAPQAPPEKSSEHPPTPAPDKQLSPPPDADKKREVDTQHLQPTPHNLSGLTRPLISPASASQPPQASAILLKLWIVIVLVALALVWWTMINTKTTNQATQTTTPDAAGSPPRQERVPQPKRMAPAQHTTPPRSMGGARPHTPPARRRHKRQHRQKRPLHTRATMRPRPHKSSARIPGCPPDNDQGQWLRFRITPLVATLHTPHPYAQWSGGICVWRTNKQEALRLKFTHSSYQPCLLHRRFFRRKYQLRLRPETKGATTLLDDRLDACLQ